MAGGGKTLHSIRIQKEFKLLKKQEKPWLEGYSQVPNKEAWIFKIKPTCAPYTSVLSLLIDCTGEYPFRTPIVTFNPPIYHPNVDKNGDVCISIIAFENWKPTTTMYSIILSVLSILAEPDLSRPVRCDVAEEYIHRRKEFDAKAAEVTAKAST